MPVISHRPSRAPAPSTDRPRRLARQCAAPVAVTAALVIAGCGGSSSGAKVASLSGHGSGSARRSSLSSGAIPDPDGRPRLSLDATKSQQVTVDSAYQDCLSAHHVNPDPAKAEPSRAAPCLHLEPLAPWQLDPANPQARAFVGRTVSCLDAKGYTATARMVSDLPDVAPEWYVSFSNADLHDGSARLNTAENACRQQAQR